MSDTLDYLIWSHKNGAWWKADRRGYTDRLSVAGRFSRADALNYSANSISGTADRLGALPNLPVRLADVLDMLRPPDGSEYQPGTSTWE